MGGCSYELQILVKICATDRKFFKVPFKEKRKKNKENSWWGGIAPIMEKLSA